MVNGFTWIKFTLYQKWRTENIGPDPRSTSVVSCDFSYTAVNVNITHEHRWLTEWWDRRGSGRNDMGLGRKKERKKPRLDRKQSITLCCTLSVPCMMCLQHISRNETGRSCRKHGKEDNAYKIWSETWTEHLGTWYGDVWIILKYRTRHR
jgi:hypothetical protein